VNYPRISLYEAIRRLEVGDNNFCVDVEVINVGYRNSTSKGNIFVRALIKDKSRKAVLVVWGES